MSCPSPAAAGPELTLTQVLQALLPEYLQTHSVPAHQLKVLPRLGRCRSVQLGWTVWHCQDCQRWQGRPNGCGDRHCPSCQHQLSRQWLQTQRAALLPLRYFHWLFTLPAALRPLALQNPAALYGLRFDSASATLLQFGQQRFAAQLGITAILHTWGQNLLNHPHLHCLVTGGGLTAQNTWSGPKQARGLFPIHAVGHLFRAKFCAGLLQLRATGQLQFHGALQPLSQRPAFTLWLRQLRARRWIVFAKGSVVGPDPVLDYLGRDTHRVALSNSRLRALDPKARTVTFTYKDYTQGQRLKSMVLPASEFLRRFLLHVLPRGFTKIRHYGLPGNNQRRRCLPWARAALEHSPLRFQPKPPSLPAARSAAPMVCPHCQSTQLRCSARIDAAGKWTLFAGARRLAPLPSYLDTS